MKLEIEEIDGDFSKETSWLKEIMDSMVTKYKKKLKLFG